MKGSIRDEEDDLDKMVDDILNNSSKYKQISGKTNVYGTPIIGPVKGLDIHKKFSVQGGLVEDYKSSILPSNEIKLVGKRYSQMSNPS